MILTQDTTWLKPNRRSARRTLCRGMDRVASVPSASESFQGVLGVDGRIVAAIAEDALQGFSGDADGEVVPVEQIESRELFARAQLRVQCGAKRSCSDPALFPKRHGCRRS